MSPRDAETKVSCQNPLAPTEVPLDQDGGDAVSYLRRTSGWPPQHPGRSWILASRESSREFSMAARMLVVQHIASALDMTAAPTSFGRASGYSFHVDRRKREVAEHTAAAPAYSQNEHSVVKGAAMTVLESWSALLQLSGSLPHFGLSWSTRAVFFVGTVTPATMVERIAPALVLANAPSAVAELVAPAPVCGQRHPS